MTDYFEEDGDNLSCQVAICLVLLIQLQWWREQLNCLVPIILVHVVVVLFLHASCWQWRTHLFLGNKVIPGSLIFAHAKLVIAWGMSRSLVVRKGCVLAALTCLSSSIKNIICFVWHIERMELFLFRIRHEESVFVTFLFALQSATSWGGGGVPQIFLLLKFLYFQRESDQLQIITACQRVGLFVSVRTCSDKFSAVAGLLKSLLWKVVDEILAGFLWLICAQLWSVMRQFVFLSFHL